MPGITDEIQYNRLTEDWRQIHNVIWGIPSIAVSIIAGVIIVAYNLEGWPRVVVLGLGSIFLFSMTVEIVKKRLTMDAISARMQRIEMKSKLTVGPFPSGTHELIREQKDLVEEKEQEQKKAGIQVYEENREGTTDSPYLLFKFSHARACLTYVLLTAAILASVLTFWEFIKYMNYERWSYVVGLTTVIIIVSVLAILIYGNYDEYKEKWKKKE